MSAPLHPAFRFATEAQWNACLFLGADRRTVEARTGLRPFAPYALPPRRFATRGAFAPAITDAGEILWRDRDGQLQRLAFGDDAPEAVEAPPAISAATRLVAAPGVLWAGRKQIPLQAFDSDRLACLLVAEVGDSQLVDFAGDGRGGVYALTGSGQTRFVVHVGHAGQVKRRFRVDCRDASALVFLASSKRLVLLAERASRLVWIDPAIGLVTSSLAIAGLRSCFEPLAIGSDGCSRLFLAGVDGPPAGGRHQILMLDSDGSLLNVTTVDERPTGLVADRTHLYTTTRSGLLRFDPATSVPKGAGELRTALLTPALESSAVTVQRWTRIEAKAELPPGCAIEIAFAATDDTALRDRITTRLADRRESSARRLEYWRSEAGPVRRFVFHGDDRADAGKKIVVTVPLHDLKESYLWVQVSLIASPGGRIPQLDALSVLYPGPTLMEHLPAIYRSGELEAGNFVRGLVGVLEATTQGLDARIGELGRNIHPKTADGEWLDYVARWLGLPWDDALSLDQKRRIAGRGADIARGHGTRAGLEALLESLMPEPRRFRIVDTIAEYGVAKLGGALVTGSRVPAILSGLPKTAAELGNKAVLGSARLPCPGIEGATTRLTGHVQIDIAADAAEQKAWSPWLRTLIEELLPATARLDLRWVARMPSGGLHELSDDLTLEGEPVARLGSDSVAGMARLGGRRRTTIPDRLSGNSSLQ